MISLLSAITGEQLTGALGLAGMLGAALAVGRSRRIEKTLDLLGTANDQLRKQIEDGERARKSDRATCDRELSEMRGQLTALTTGFGRDIARAIADEWRQMRDEPPAVSREDIARRKAHREGDT